MDWASRTELSWRLSTTLDARFCVEALHKALERYGPPEIFNSDQGAANSPASTAPTCSRRRAFASRWTAKAAGWTTSRNCVISASTCAGGRCDSTTAIVSKALRTISIACFASCRENRSSLSTISAARLRAVRTISPGSTGPDGTRTPSMGTARDGVFAFPFGAMRPTTFPRVFGFAFVVGFFFFAGFFFGGGGFFCNLYSLFLRLQRRCSAFQLPRNLLPRRSRNRRARRRAFRLVPLALRFTIRASMVVFVPVRHTMEITGVTQGYTGQTGSNFRVKQHRKGPPWVLAPLRPPDLDRGYLECRAEVMEGRATRPAARSVSPI